MVDDQLRTNVAGIWALGDCNGRGGFTHTSYNDSEALVAANLLDHETRSVADRIRAYNLYVDPPLGRCGMTGREACLRPACADRAAAHDASGRAVEGRDPKFMKVLVDADSKEFLGAAILGTGGDEVIHYVLDLMCARTIYRYAMGDAHPSHGLQPCCPPCRTNYGPSRHSQLVDSIRSQVSRRTVRAKRDWHRHGRGGLSRRGRD